MKKRSIVLIKVSELFNDETRSAQPILTLSRGCSRAKRKSAGICRCGWEVSPDNYVKLNVDVAFHILKEDDASTSVVLRNDHGYVLAMSNCTIPNVEGIASQNGLVLCRAGGGATRSW